MLQYSVEERVISVNVQLKRIKMISVNAPVKRGIISVNDSLIFY
jgi:hypothetical protein